MTSLLTKYYIIMKLYSLSQKILHFSLLLIIEPIWLLLLLFPRDLLLSLRDISSSIYLKCGACWTLSSKHRSKITIFTGIIGVVNAESIISFLYLIVFLPFPLLWLNQFYLFCTFFKHSLFICIHSKPYPYM